MELTGSGEPAVEKLRRLVEVQGELIAVTRGKDHRFGGPGWGRRRSVQTIATLMRRRAMSYGGRGRRPLKKAGAALAGPASSAWPAASGRRPKRLRSEGPPRGLAVPGWSPSLTNPVGTAGWGLATFPAGGGCVGSVSASEHAPARPAASRATTLHGSWVAKGGAAYVVSAVRVHTDLHGTLLRVMTTHIAATLALGNDALDGRFTFKAARPDGRMLSRGTGMLHASRTASPQ